MTYKLAKDCFKENIGLTGGSQRDPISYNLYAGLFSLTQELERDNAALKKEIAQIRRELRDLEQTVSRLR